MGHLITGGLYSQFLFLCLYSLCPAHMWLLSLSSSYVLHQGGQPSIQLTHKLITTVPAFCSQPCLQMPNPWTWHTSLQWPLYQPNPFPQHTFSEHQAVPPGAAPTHKAADQYSLSCSTCILSQEKCSGKHSPWHTPGVTLF